MLPKTRANMCVDNIVAAEALHAETNKTRTSENKPGFSEIIRGSCMLRSCQAASNDESSSELLHAISDNIFVAQNLKSRD